MRDLYIVYIAGSAKSVFKTEFYENALCFIKNMEYQSKKNDDYAKDKYEIVHVRKV